MKKFYIIDVAAWTIISLAVIFLATAGVAGDARAANPAPAELAAKLQKAYESTTSLTADFDQTTTITMTNRTREGKGTVAIRKPGLMRWDYTAPDLQVLLCDGDKMSMYLSRAKQLIVSPAKEYLQSDVTYAFFTGSGDILRDFEPGAVSEADAVGGPAGFDTGGFSLKLTPRKAHPQVDYINIWLRDDFLIKRIQIRDHFGSVNDIVFSNLKINQDLAPDLFTFTPPDNTEIIEQ